jgi:hypothetical protein
MLLGGVVLVSGASASAAPSASWSGGGANPDWTTTGNWAGSVTPVAGGTTAAITFPDIPACDTSSPPARACYRSADNQTGDTIDGLRFTSRKAYGYTLTGNGFRLGAGGITYTPAMSTSGTSPVNIQNPVTLSGNQTWTLATTDSPGGGAAGRLGFAAPLHGTSALTVDMSGDSSLYLTGDNEVGPVVVNGGAQTASVGFNSGEANGTEDLNGTDHQPVTLVDVDYQAAGSIGPLTTRSSFIGIGNPYVSPPGNLTTASATFTSGTELAPAIIGPASGSRVVAGQDYSQLGSSGPVSLGGSALSIALGTDAGGHTTCPHPSIGTVYDLVTGSHITGQLTTAGGAAVPDGMSVPLACGQQAVTVGLAIHYGATAVTGTTRYYGRISDAVEAGAVGDGQIDTFSAAVQGVAGQGAPAGTVSFYADNLGRLLCTARTSVSGPVEASGRCQSGGAPVGQDAIIAVFTPAAGSAYGGIGTNVQGDNAALYVVPSPGYRLVASDGGIFSYGAKFYGSTGGVRLVRPIVGMAGTSAGGYYLVASDGGVFAFGPGTRFQGSTGGHPLVAPIVGMALDPATGGYWMVASDGGVFSYNAKFYGSTGGIHLDRPIVGIAAAPGGTGYYLVASDGGVFAFGPGAHFQGSTGGVHLDAPIVGMAVNPATGGYYLVATDGGLFAYNTRFWGSTGGDRLVRPVVGMAIDPQTGGYWLVASDGGIFAFDAPFLGSTGGVALVRPVVGMAAG